MVFGRDPNSFLDQGSDDYVINLAVLKRAIEIDNNRLDYQASKTAQLVMQVMKAMF